MYRVGCKVMNPDGTPAFRDPTFLQETRIMPAAGRLQGVCAGRASHTATNCGYVRPPSCSSIGSNAISGLTSSSVDPAVPISMYTEAAAKSTYTGNYYVSG